MKPLIDRVIEQLDMKARAKAVAAIIVQHDAVMAQMAEALNEMMEYAGIIEERCDSVATDKSRKALSAYQALGEQS